MWQILSLIGSLFLLAAYLMLVIGTFSNRTPAYHLFNILGCLLIGLSLWFDQFNLGSFVLQISFGLVAAYAIISLYWNKSK